MPIDIKVVWHNRPFEAIIQEVVAGGHDLLLKMAHQHDKLESVIFTPTDWHLLRKCPCPVWMVKDQPWPEGGKAVVAVNLASEEDYHNSLNEKLVKETLQLADQVNHTEVHLVGAYPVTPINIAIELPEFDPSVYNDAIRGQHLLAMKALRQKFSIDEKMTHVEKGLPEEVIPDLAEHLQAGIVVLGTIGRTGISAAFLGNTAEQVIDHLRCDLLVIKPYPAYGFGRPGKLAPPGFTLSERFQNRIHAGFGIAKQHVGVLFEEQRVLHPGIAGIH